MKKYMIYVEGDMNDGDTCGDITIISEKDIPRVWSLVNKLKIIDDEVNKIRHNGKWVHQGDIFLKLDEDEEYYKFLFNEDPSEYGLLEEFYDLFSMSPSDGCEYGIHSIDKVQIIEFNKIELAYYRKY